jgi:hypothetical protein
LFEKAKGQLVSTDGKAIAIIPVTEHENDEAGIIPNEALKEAHRAAKKFRGAESYVLTVKAGRVHLEDGRSYALVDGTFPNYEQILPRYYGDAAKGVKLAQVYFNPEILMQIHEAAVGGSKRKDQGVLLTFRVNDDGSATRDVIGVKVAGLECAFMPMRL